jgi:hypothetical protein
MKALAVFLAILLSAICAPVFADAPEALLVGKWEFDSVRFGNATQPAPHTIMLLAVGENAFKQFSQDHLFISQEKGRREYGRWKLSDNGMKLTVSISGGDIHVYGISKLTNNRMILSMMNGKVHAEMVKTFDAPENHLPTAPDAATAQAIKPQLIKSWYVTDMHPPKMRDWLKSLKKTPFMYLEADGNYQTEYHEGTWFLDDDGRSIVLWEHEGTVGKRWHIRAISANELIIQRPNTDVKSIFTPGLPAAGRTPREPRPSPGAPMVTPPPPPDAPLVTPPPPPEAGGAGLG